MTMARRLGRLGFLGLLRMTKLAVLILAMYGGLCAWHDCQPRLVTEGLLDLARAPDLRQEDIVVCYICHENEQAVYAEITKLYLSEPESVKLVVYESQGKQYPLFYFKKSEDTTVVYTPDLAVMYQKGEPPILIGQSADQLAIRN